MSEGRFAEIKARYEALGDTPAPCAVDGVFGDVPWLIAEVERLQEAPPYPTTEPRVPGQRLVTVVCEQTEQARLEAAVVEAAVARERARVGPGHRGSTWTRYYAAFDAEEAAVRALIAYREASNE